MNVSDGSDLPVNVRARQPRSFKPSSLNPMPRGRFFVVGQDRERRQNNIAKIRLELELPFT
jgi:hypothetical protein